MKIAAAVVVSAIVSFAAATSLSAASGRQCTAYMEQGSSMTGPLRFVDENGATLWSIPAGGSIGSPK